MSSMPSSPFVETPSPGRRKSIRQMENSSGDVFALSQQIKSLKYELNNQKNEREQERLRFENSLRELEQKFQQEGKRADSLESDQLFLFNKQNETAGSLDRARGEFNAERIKYEATIKNLRNGNETLENQLINAEQELEEGQRKSKYEIQQLEKELQRVTREYEAADETLGDTVDELGKCRARIQQQEKQYTELKLEYDHLKLQAGDLKDVERISKELSDQISLVHSLENQIAQKDTQIKKLFESEHLCNVYAQEKSSLQTKLKTLDDLRDQVGSLEVQLAQLRQEKNKWTMYLEKDDNFNTPDEVVRALVHERLEKISLLDKLGQLQADKSTTDYSESVQQDMTNLKQELEEMQLKYDQESKLRLKLQRQKELAQKETEFLRLQLKSYDEEENVENASKLRIEELEKLIDSYKSEIVKLMTDKSQNPPSAPRKPSRSSEDQQQASELKRKCRNLQVELDRCQLEIREKAKEIEVLSQQLSNVQQSPKHRILQLKDNPSTKHEAVKIDMLNALKKENEDLLSKSRQAQTVPLSSLERLEQEITRLESSLKEHKKRSERLKEVFSKKSLEFREAVYHLLGYKVDLLPNKKIRATSVYDENDSFTFVADPKHKHKFIGIDESPVTRQYENLITFWITERKDIPCFLAAFNLEQYDKTTKAASF